MKGRRAYFGLALLAVLILAGVLLARYAWERFAPISDAAVLTTGGKPSSNAEANDHFERAWMLLESQNNLPRSRALMERALEIDPHFAEARAWYGFLWLLEIDGGFSNDPNLLYEAEKELRQALVDDPQNGRAHSALAALYLIQGRKELLPAQIDRASKADPDFLDTSTWLVLYHRLNGDSERAVALAREILVRRPIFWPARFQLACALHDNGDVQTALVELAKVLEQDPGNRYAVEAVARIHLESGESAEARSLLQRLRNQNPRSYRTQLAEAMAAAVEGRRDEVLLLMDEPLLKYGQIYVWAPADIAAVHAVLGDHASALEWLDRAVRFGDERLEWFQRDPLLADVRSHPRFKQILDSIAMRRQQRNR